MSTETKHTKEREEFERVTNEIAANHFCVVPKWNLEFVDGKYTLVDVQIRFEIWQHRQQRISTLEAQNKELLKHMRLILEIAQDNDIIVLADKALSGGG